MKRLRFTDARLTSQASKHRKKKRGQRLKSTCVALGLATAWGGTAEADVIIQGEITPQRTLANALIYYGNNRSTGLFVPLGTLPANETTVFTHHFVQDNPQHEFMYLPEFLLPDHLNTGYFIIGLHDEEGVTGLTVSFPSNSPIPLGDTWEEVFVHPNFTYTKQNVIDAVASGSGAALISFALYFGDQHVLNSDDPLSTHYGSTSTLVSFSEAEIVGTAFVTIVPEPAAISLFAIGGGVLWAFRRSTN